MTSDAELMRLELENQIAGNRAFVAGDPAVAARYGTSFETVAGLNCSTCRVWDHPLFNRVIGAGVLAPLDERGLDTIVAHYSGKTCNVEVYEGITPEGLVATLERAGFAKSEHGLEAHGLESDREPPARATGATVRRISPVAGCYSGSVLARFRGKGIQHALIAARVREGLRRGRRIFISQTDPDSPSGHNLHDLGFRTLYRATWYTRQA